MTEAKIISNPHGFNKGGEKDIAPTCTSSKWQDNNFVCEPISVAMRGRNPTTQARGVRVMEIINKELNQI